MSRYDRMFERCQAERRIALGGFLILGYPSRAAMPALLDALVEGGADMIELGIPFSDPVADGPVIQHAGERAIARGIGIDAILGWVREFRIDDAHTPVVLMGYLNPIEIRGSTRFAREARAAGIDGVLVVDVPVEESATLQPLLDAGIEQVFLVAPTTTDARLAAIRARARGFMYYVSFAGITGASHLDVDAVRTKVAHVRQGGDIPVAVGFGVHDAATASAIAECADAVVIGSALVSRLAEARDGAHACRIAHEFLGPIRAALDGAQAG